MSPSFLKGNQDPNISSCHFDLSDDWRLEEKSSAEIYWLHRDHPAALTFARKELARIEREIQFDESVLKAERLEPGTPSFWTRKRDLIKTSIGKIVGTVSARAPHAPDAIALPPVKN